MVTTLTVPLSWQDEGPVELDQDNIKVAQKMYYVLYKGKVKASYVHVNWKELRVNGEDYGVKFTNSHSEAERQQLMDAVGEVFLSAFEPYYLREELKYPAQFNTWRVIGRHAGDTVVQVRIPSTRRFIRFTLRANRLVALDVQ
jgi:hypothetical protein